MTQRMYIKLTKNESEIIERIKEAHGLHTVNDVIKSSLHMHGGVHDFQCRGFTDLVVRNPETGEERVLVVVS